MSGKYIDLADRIGEGAEYSNTTSFCLGIECALRWLDEHLTPFIESIIRQEKAEALRQAAYVAGDECDEKGGNDWFPSEWAGQVSGWLEYRAGRYYQEHQPTQQQSDPWAASNNSSPF